MKTFGRAAVMAALAVLVCAETGFSSGAQIYRDPGGRFSVPVPEGWTASPQGARGADGVQISRGTSWMMVGPVTGARQPSDVVNALQPQFAAQYTNFTHTNGGAFQLNGRPAFAATYHGLNPRGMQVNLGIFGVSGPAGTQFAIMSSVPTSEGPALNDAMQSILQSIQFRGETVPPVPPAPPARNTPASRPPAGSARHAIVDPALKMNAYYVTAPPNWRVDAVVMPGTVCEEHPIQVVRASSPDGLSGFYMLPRVDWSWLGNGQQKQPDAGCIPVFERVSARDYLIRFVLPGLQARFVRVVDMSQVTAELQRGLDAVNAQGGATTFQTDSAGMVVTYLLNGQPVEEYVESTVGFSDVKVGGVYTPVLHNYKCYALVTRFRAPAGQLRPEALKQTVALDWDQPWYDFQNRLWLQIRLNQIQEIYKAIGAAVQEQGRIAQKALERNQQIINDNLRVSAQIQQQAANEAYLHRQASVLDHYVRMYDKQRTSDNMVDYILDCTRLSPTVSVSTANGYCGNRETNP